ncbi:hypothetical protein GU927_008190 [Rhodobacteraceae bacterium HSP-20]|uniref:Uncharacterized protein n=1 Tax=Paragemmobacter amnigenus TaxID=2852097 RepID=A0ABS6J234_9RHOB|nr:hypothetical protein [Rhodobacter amnigenus]MBU9697826.1 hypothetical protein [Rhodobacter amnigenus]MBV4389053.1 hypothetical protein [Rhodobacter amnigenus]
MAIALEAGGQDMAMQGFGIAETVTRKTPFAGAQQTRFRPEGRRTATKGKDQIRIWPIRWRAVLHCSSKLHNLLNRKQKLTG